MWVGIGKFISVWIGGEISDRIGRKIMAVGGGVLYIISFVIMLVTDNATVACVAGFLSGVATSGFWDGSLYPAIAEANPKYSASTTIGIKLVISISGIVYPLFVAMNSGANWHINVMIPIVMSVIATIMAICTPFIYDDERKIAASDGDEEGAKNKAQEEIQAARTLCSSSPMLWLTLARCSFGFFLIMFIGRTARTAVQLQFGITNLGLDGNHRSRLDFDSYHWFGNRCIVLGLDDGCFC